jgi:hypothetical protein
VEWSRDCRDHGESGAVGVKTCLSGEMWFVEEDRTGSY